MRRAAAALFGEAIAGVVQHQLAHRARRQREEVRAILHGVGAGAVEAQVTLVDQRGRVQRALSAGEHAAGDALEIVVDQGDRLRPGRLIAGTRLVQEFGDLTHSPPCASMARA